MADDVEGESIHNGINQLAGSLEYGGRKVMILGIVLDNEDGAMFIKGYCSRVSFHEFMALNAGAHEQLRDMCKSAAENM